MNGNKKLFAPGHRACPGCSVPIVAKLALEVTGPEVIVVTATGCLETFTSPINLSSWEVPWIHSLFENSAAVATGVRAAVKRRKLEGTKVVVMSGDGGTYDIGFGALSGMFERGDDILYICYDNEAYMNTGVQRSSATPYGASTTTSPAGLVSFGKEEPKKNMTAIALAHGVPYVASASIAYPNDFKKKVKNGLEAKGPAFIHILAPCNIGWGFNTDETIEVARLGIETGLYPLYEYRNGELNGVKKLKEKKPAIEFLRHQKRFNHIVEAPEKYKEQIEYLENLSMSNINYYKLMG